MAKINKSANKIFIGKVSTTQHKMKESFKSKEVYVAYFKIRSQL